MLIYPSDSIQRFHAKDHTTLTITNVPTWHYFENRTAIATHLAASGILRENQGHPMDMNGHDDHSV